MNKKLIDELVSDEILNITVAELLKDPNSEIICNNKVLSIITKKNNRDIRLLVCKTKEI